MFLALLALILIFIWFGFRKPTPQDWIDFHPSRKRIHRYSGLDPESYIQFDENMDMFIKRKELRYLYQALESARNIGLSIVNPDDGDITEDINRTADEIGRLGELYVNSPSRYLNNIVDSQEERDVDLYDPFWARREAAREIRTYRAG